MHNVACTLALLMLSVSTAVAAPTIELLPPGYALTGLANGGTIGTGNVIGDFSYETFRWTATDGIERLGLATVPALSVGAGTPDISYDGLSISASIVSTDNMMTQGIWRAGLGWTESMPPMPANGVMFDNSYGSAWGLSGDGRFVTGYYNGEVDGFTRARASKWSSDTGMIALPTLSDRNARVNAANNDGSVVVGWEERADGAWRPTAWRGGTKFTLTDTAAFCEAGGVSADGSIVVGSSYNVAQNMRLAALWTWNGSSYIEQQIGVLPNTQPNFGEAFLEDVSGDGTLAGGWNRYVMSPGGPTDGIVWTPAGGLVNATDYIAGLGLASQIPTDMDIRGMGPVSPDGSAIAGYGLLSRTSQFQAFIIHLTPPPCVGDADGDRDVDFSDITAVLANFGTSGAPFKPGDADGNTGVNFADITTVLANFGFSCP